MYHAGLVYVCPLLYIPRTKVKPFKIACFFPNARGGGGVLPHMGYMGMCRCEGMVFKQFTLG